jgi:hypothetical protein
MTIQARKWVFDVLMNSPELTAIVGNRIFAASSIGTDPESFHPQRPFLVYRSGIKVPALRDAAETNLYTFYVYDEVGSYIENIEPAIEAIKNAFKLRSHEFWQGKQIFDVIWRDTSEDLYDDMFRAVFRFITMDVVTSS